MDVEHRTLFHVLGPVEADDGDHGLSLGPPRQRALLGVLLLHRDEVVSTARLVDALWGEDPPRTAGHSLQTYVSGLRVVLGADRIETRPPGYVFHAASEEVDACLLEERIRAGVHALDSGDAATAAALFARGLALWHGEPLADVAGTLSIGPEVARLRELYLRALDGWAAAQLRMGRHEDVLPELERLTRAHPLAERLWCHRLVALYRAGRSADALRAYQDLRSILVEELGVDPSVEVARVYEQILVQDPHLLAIGTAPPAASDGELRNPYKGLRPFAEEDAADFFGRDDLVREMLGVLAEPGRGLLAVVGPSGSGKSSAVRAGLLPAVDRGALAGLEKAIVMTVLPSRDPVGAVAAALGGVGGGSRIPPPDDPGWLTRLLEERAGDSPVLLVIDQFEELFTLVDTDVRRWFLDALTLALDADRIDLRIVVTLRADFYDRPLGHADFGRRFVAGTVAVLPLSAEQLEEAAVGPAHRMGIVFEPALVAAMVAEVADQPGALPLFQYALTELFERRRGDTLALDAYRAFGGVRGAVSRRADDLYGRLSADEQHAARQLFLRLVHPGEHVDDSSRRLPAGEIAGLNVDPVAMQTVLDRFGRARLVSFDRDPRTGAATIEMAHDALLRTWDRLGSWIDDAREDLRRRDALVVAVDEWRSEGEHAGFLLTGPRLDAYERWAETTSLRLTSRERRFLDASLHRRDRDREAEQARHRQEEQLRRRAARRLWGLAAAVGALMMIAAVVVVGVLSDQGPRVGLVYAGGDGTFEAYIAAGVDRLERDFDVVAERVESFGGYEDATDDIASLCQAGSDVVFLGGFNYAVPGLVAAPQCPDTTLVALDADTLVELRNLSPAEFAELGLPVREMPANIVPVVFASEEGSYLAGAAAALSTRTGVVGFIGGQPDPIIETFRAGFEAGVTAVSPDVDVLATYVTHRTDDTSLLEAYGNPTLARAAALAMYEDGADVIYAVAGDSGRGVIDAAIERSDATHRWVIGVDVDWAVKEPPSRARHVLTSVLKRLDVAIVDTMQDVFDHGEIPSQPRRYGLADGGVTLSEEGGHLSAHQERLDTLRQQIIAGAVEIPTVPGGPTRPAPTQGVTAEDARIEFDGEACTYHGPTRVDTDELLHVATDNTTELALAVISARAIEPPPFDPEPVELQGIPGWVDEGTMAAVPVDPQTVGRLTVTLYPGLAELVCTWSPSPDITLSQRVVQITVTPAS